jgi:hypothetical protein
MSDWMKGMLASRTIRPSLLIVGENINWLHQLGWAEESLNAPLFKVVICDNEFETQRALKMHRPWIILLSSGGERWSVEFCKRFTKVITFAACGSGLDCDGVISTDYVGLEELSMLMAQIETLMRRYGSFDKVLFEIYLERSNCGGLLSEAVCSLSNKPALTALSS